MKATNSKKIKKQARSGQRLTIPKPPKIGSYQITMMFHRFRFVSNANESGLGIRFEDLLDMVNMMTVSSSSAYDIFQSVKVHSVEMWATPTTLGSAPVTVTCQFSGSNAAGQYGQFRTFTSTSMGIEPAYIKAVPPRNTFTSMWQNSNSNIAFKLWHPTNTIVDVVVSLKSQTSGAGVECTNSPGAGNVGQVYYRGLDGQAAGSTSYNVPTGISQD